MPRIKIADPDDFEPAGLKPPQASKFMGYSVATLERWRAAGIGPRFVQEGRAVIYPREELLAWLRAKAKR
jgi:predicted DNA-binding transcriptional regulator AlpA